jgi:hypothetical protein
VNKILIIGSASHEQVDNIEWTQPFGDLEKYDRLIIDLTSFPKDYPPTLFTNIGVLKRVARLFIRDNKEIFCIMDKPFNILFKKIPLNFSWMPFPQKLTVNPMLLGRVINNKNERLAEYFKCVEKWDNELVWQHTDNVSFEVIAVNKVQNPIAITITMMNRGKIHFLPKPTKATHSKAINILADLVTKEEKQEYSWLNKIEHHLNLFSVDNNKITKTVHQILEEFGITTTISSKFDKPHKKNSISVQVISTQGKVETQNTEINRLVKSVENQKNHRRIIVVANTYKELPIKNRANKQHLDHATKLFFETNNVIFLTTLSLYNLYTKVLKGIISFQEAVTLIQTQNGEIQI